ncbi:MAG TPA: prolyl oligopeptidase family serine peptidase [Armatimonadota bacterium]|jgi:predicted peptidase
MAAYEYYAHYPDGYDARGERVWPLLLTLHGAGERDVTLDALSRHHYYLSTYALTAARYPCIVVVPHCPPRHYWEPDKIESLLTGLLLTERADADRIYLTGFSMGGYGAWFTAGCYPGRYAAIAPVCGGGDVRDARKLAGLPIWAFHGALDQVVPVEETLAMIDAIENVGGHPRLTIYPEGDHGVWDQTFANPELYAWFLSQQRGKAQGKVAA